MCVVVGVSVWSNVGVMLECIALGSVFGAVCWGCHQTKHTFEKFPEQVSVKVHLYNHVLAPGGSRGTLEVLGFELMT